MTYRNKRLLDLARLAPCCFLCGKDNDGTVVAAHANMQSLGKGIGHKAADLPAYLCSTCHDWYDGRSNPDAKRESKNAEWTFAAVHSMAWALENHPEVFK